MARMRTTSMAILAVLLVALPLILASTARAHPVPNPLNDCSSAPNQRWYGSFRTYDLGNANATGAQAAWEEQDYQVWDHFAAANRFVLSTMWVGFTNGRFVEVGFKRTPERQGNTFYRARRVSANDFRRDYINKAPQGAHTWHVYKLEYIGGVWQAYIDGQAYGGYGALPANAVRMTLGLELTSNCSVAHMTYFGSPSTSSSYAFRYETSWGLWTTWGSGGRSCDGEPCHDPNAHTQWLTWAIFGRAWADGYGGY